VPNTIPNSYVNPNVRAVGVSKLRSLSGSKLRGMDKTLVIQENDEPIAVLVKYEDYLAMQQKMLDLVDAHSILSDKNAFASVLTGRAESEAGKSRSIEDVRDGLRKSNGK